MTEIVIIVAIKRLTMLTWRKSTVMTVSIGKLIDVEDRVSSFLNVVVMCFIAVIKSTVNITEIKYQAIKL